MNKKSLVTIQILDLFGSPISKAQYEVKIRERGKLSLLEQQTHLDVLLKSAEIKELL